MDIVIREYIPVDFDACCALQHELAQYHAEIYDDPSIAENNPTKTFTEYLSRPDRSGTWVAEHNGSILGFAGLLDTIVEEGAAEIEPVVISSETRGQGTGSELIKYVIEEARKNGFRFLTIRPVIRNEQAFNLYFKMGFDHIGTIELFQDLDPESTRTWKSGISIHGKELKY